MKRGKDFCYIKPTAVWNTDLPIIVQPTQASVQARLRYLSGPLKGTSVCVPVHMGVGCEGGEEN